MIDIDIQQELDAELIAIEKLLWTGRPRKGIIFKLSDIFYIPYSLLWLGVVSAMFFSSYSTVKLSFYNFYLLLFMLFGVYFVIGRFFYDSIRRANTLYGITNMRVIIRSGMLYSNFKSVYIEDLPEEFSITEKSDGSGTIIFGPNNFRISMLPGMGRLNMGYVPPPRLEFINNMKSVYNLLLKLKQDQSKSNG